MNGFLDVAPHRAELFDAVRHLEQALTAAEKEPLVTDEIRDLIDEVRADLALHRALAEGKKGLHLDIVRSSPRHAYAVRRLHAEHRMLFARVEELRASAASRVYDGGATLERLRSCARSLMREITKHRQREADLVYEAYQTDLGGET